MERGSDRLDPGFSLPKTLQNGFGGNMPTDEELWAYRRALNEIAAIAVTDLEGRILHVNERFRALSGYRVDELIGQPARLLKSGFHSREFYAEMWRTIRSGKVWRGEIRNRRKDGTFYWSSLLILPLCGADGKPIQYISVRNDISELKAAQKQSEALHTTQRRLNEAEQSVLNRDRMVSMTAHELKTPLTSLQLRMETALRRLSGAPDGLDREQQERVYRTSVETVKRMTGMVSDLLDFAKIAAGKLPLRAESVNLVRLVDEVIHDYREDFERAGVAVNFAAPDEARCECDRDRIRQVIINLLTNALKYGEKSPIEILIRPETGCSRWSLVVRDRGRGMSKDFQKHLFEFFSRESEVGVSGHGLGLWITSKIVRAHEGDIRVVSELGAGAEFTVSLPFKPELDRRIAFD